MFAVEVFKSFDEYTDNPHFAIPVYKEDFLTEEEADEWIASLDDSGYMYYIMYIAKQNNHADDLIYEYEWKRGFVTE